MIKGKTIIELTNVNTGEVERHEDTNLVTNALNKIFEPIGIVKNEELFFNIYNDYDGSYIPYYEHLTGGVLLFDNKIEENADTLYAPLNAKLVGCGAYGMQNSTTGTCRGNFNSDESEADPKSGMVKYVYDFPTDKANGTINCVCLTSDRGGGCSYGSEDATRDGFSSMHYVLSTKTVAANFSLYSPDDEWMDNQIEFPFMVDLDEDVMYVIKVNGANSLSILKRHAFFKSISLFDDPVDVGGKIVETKQLTTLTTALTRGVDSHNVDLANMKLYITSGESYEISSYSDIYIVIVDLTTFEVTEKTVVNKTGKTLSCDFHNLVYNNYIYLSDTDSPYDFYKINIDNDSEYTKISRSKSATVDTEISYELNGRIYLEGCDSGYSAVDRCAVIDTDTNKMYDMENYTIFGERAQMIPVKGKPWLFYCLSNYDSDATDRFMMPANYLATINNLSEPVTKTNEQTMKLTYILQRADE